MGDKIWMYIPAGIQHIGHKCSGCGRPGSINDIRHDSGERGSNCICNNCTGCRPCKDFDLSWGIENNITDAIINDGLSKTCPVSDSLDCISPLLHKPQNLIELGGKQVERGEDAAVRA